MNEAYQPRREDLVECIIVLKDGSKVTALIHPDEVERYITGESKERVMLHKILATQ
jgi:hypothetical protein